MYTRDSRFLVRPFTRQADGDQVIVGRQEGNVFIALPPDAVEVLDLFATGRSFGEVQDFYLARYGEQPDLEDFLQEMERRGFLAATDGALLPEPSGGGQPGEPSAPARRFHFENLSERLARALFSRSSLMASGFLTLAALLLSGLHPELIPGREALLFPDQRAAKVLVLLLLSYGTLFLHEMGHLVAARAVGVRSRMGIGNRLWVLVAETDLTGLWALPRRQRFLPLLAGLVVDAVLASSLLLFLFVDRQRWVEAPAIFGQLAAALLFFLLLRILWQFFFFLRTDLYYVLATLCGCSNLLKDTEDYLRRQWAHLLSRPARIDQSRIPPREMRIVRLYAPLYLAGRVLALGMLTLVVLPVLWSYGVTIVTALRTGYAADPDGFLDTFALALMPFSTLALGMWLWLTNLMKPRRRNP